jgi:hypothetical protein
MSSLLIGHCSRADVTRTKQPVAGQFESTLIGWRLTETAGFNRKSQALNHND